MYIHTGNVYKYVYTHTVSFVCVFLSLSLSEGQVGSFLVRLSSVDKSERHYSLSVK